MCMSAYEKMVILHGEHNARILCNAISSDYWKFSKKIISKKETESPQEILITLLGLQCMDEEIKALSVGRELIEVANEAHKQEHIAGVIEYYQAYQQTHNIDNFKMMLSVIENMIKVCESDCETVDIKNVMKNEVKQMYDRLNSY